MKTLGGKRFAVDGTSSRGTCRCVHVVAGTDLPEPALQREQLLVNLQAGCKRVDWRGSGRAAGDEGERVFLQTQVLLVTLGEHAVAYDALLSLGQANDRQHPRLAALRLDVLGQPVELFLQVFSER